MPLGLVSLSDRLPFHSRLEEQLYLERCGMLRSPHSLYPSYPVGGLGGGVGAGLSSLYGLQGLQGLRYPPALPEVLPSHLSMLSPAMAAERLKLEEEHRLRLREEEKERDRERERDREQREQRERDRERKQEEERERDSAGAAACARRDKAKRASPSHTSLSHHDSTGESVSRSTAGHLTLKE